MRILLFLVTLTIMFFACQPNTDSTEKPTDLAGLKNLLKEKRAALADIKNEIAEIQKDIEVLDTTKREKPKRLVTTQLLERSNFNRFIEIQSTVQADDLVSASSEMGGRLVTMKWKEGDYIKTGQLVAKIDMESVDKQIAELEKGLELANDLYVRQKRLWDQKIGTEVQFLQAKNSKERLEKSLETIRFQLTKASVYSPKSGYVDRVMIKSGEMASPGMPIIQTLNTNKVKVVAEVPEIYLSAVKRGEMVNIKFPALDLERKARVSLLGRTINPSNRTFAVECNLANGNGVLKPNLLASMFINDYSQKDVVTIPLELVQQEISGKDFVYIKGQKEGSDIAQKVYVETGENFEGKVIITTGLEGNEEIIIDGARGLAENELIEIKTPTEKNNG